MLYYTILLRGVMTSGLVDNATISVEGMEKGLEKLESVIGTKILWHSGILSDNLVDEVDDCSDNLRPIAEKVDPTHTSIVNKKHDIMAMIWNRGAIRGT